MTTIIPRSAWTSDPNGRKVALSLPNVKGILLHWPAGNNYRTLTEAEVKQKLLAWKAMHERKGWADIGYNYAVDMSGRIWDLTGLTQGAHAGSATGNKQWVGIVLIVGENESPTAEMIASVVALRAFVLTKRSSMASVAGHSDVRPEPTACPGPAVRSLIRSGAFGAAGSPAVPGTGGGGGSTSSLLKKGSKGEAVKALQRQLNALVGAGLAVDGDFGTKTDAALRRFQKSKGLSVDGIAGPRTLAALNAGSAPAPAPSPTAPSGRLLQSGVSGEDVRRLQSALNHNFPLYSNLKADGIYGAKTAAVVSEFQRRVGIKADGKVGPQTRAALAAHGITGI